MKIKFFFLACAFLGICQFTSGQSQDTIFEHFDKLEEASRQAREQKNFKKYLQINKEILDYYDRIPKEEQEGYKYFLACATYDQACGYSLTGKKKQALAMLQKAIERGMSDIQNIMVDSDLNPLRNEPSFPDITRGANYLETLRNAGEYTSSDSLKLTFSYMNPNDPNLVRLRLHFNLDSIAGSGNELSKIKNLMLWVHNTVPHNGSFDPPQSKNAIDLIEYSQREKKGMNCRMLATILNECYLAMGFKSRFVTCLPKTYYMDCHVINSVYSATLDKWIWMDPTMNAYVMDENGTPLSISEVRQALRDKRPIVLNADANWNNTTTQTKEHYLEYYMAKNLYYLRIPQRSEYNTETYYDGKKPTTYIELIPSDYVSNSNYIKTTNEAEFWQSPYQ